MGGGEGGGHTGDIATSILIPKVVDACRGKISPLTGEPVIVCAAGGIFDGRGLAAAWPWARLECGLALVSSLQTKLELGLITRGVWFGLITATQSAQLFTLEDRCEFSKRRMLWIGKRIVWL